MSTSSARRPRTSPSATPTAPVAKGRVIFVGTGPGDPDLLTLGAIAALADASSVILDNDRQREILESPGDHARRGCRGDHDRSDRGAQAVESFGPGQDRAQASLAPVAEWYVS